MCSLHGVSHCNTLQHTATCCNTLQHAATRCNTLQSSQRMLHAVTQKRGCECVHCDRVLHCNTLQHSALCCNTLQHAATLAENATCCKKCDMLQHKNEVVDVFIAMGLYTATHYNTLQHTATCYNTLQHTATHCYTLQRSQRM